MQNRKPHNFPAWRNALHEIIFETETASGKAFDSTLIVAIVSSILLVIMESVASLRYQFGSLFNKLEWTFTILFTIEYILRLICVKKPLRYAVSFYGVVDFVAIFPMYFELLNLGTENLIAIRILRLLRIFRIFKLSEYFYEATIMQKAMAASLKRIAVFLSAVFSLIIIIGALIYTIEGEKNGFTDIPTSMYWAIVTLTTVGYGDIAPQTEIGKLLASIVMLLGYGIIAVPTGIVTVELSRFSKHLPSTQACPSCGRDADSDAVYCKYCGSRI